MLGDTKLLSFASFLTYSSLFLPALSAPTPAGVAVSVDSCIRLLGNSLCRNLPDTTCNNQGLAYAIKRHNFERKDLEYSNLQVDFFKTAPAIQQGYTTRLGYRNDEPQEPMSIYEGTPISTENIAISHTGYFVSPLDGEYTISFPFTDDITLLWLGDNASDSYTRENANLEQLGKTSTTYYKTQVLEAGMYYPIRILSVNAQGAGEFAVEITGPDGEKIFGADISQGSPFLAQFSCDERFPKFA